MKLKLYNFREMLFQIIWKNKTWINILKIVIVRLNAYKIIVLIPKLEKNKFIN
jgi:hypothetical protein